MILAKKLEWLCCFWSEQINTKFFIECDWTNNMWNLYRPVLGAGGATAAPDSGRSVNPISTRGTCPPHYCWPLSWAVYILEFLCHNIGQGRRKIWKSGGHVVICIMCSLVKLGLMICQKLGPLTPRLRQACRFTKPDWRYVIYYSGRTLITVVWKSPAVAVAPTILACVCFSAQQDEGI